MVQVFFLCFLTATLFGCQSSLFTYRGTIAKPEGRIALPQGGPHRGFWQTFDMSLHYRYWRNADQLEIFGDVELAKHLKYNFRVTENLFLRLNFLDSYGKVLDSKLVLCAGYRKMIKKWRFHRSLALPPGTTSVALSYNGEVRQSGGSSTWAFWRRP